MYLFYFLLGSFLPQIFSSKEQQNILNQIEVKKKKEMKVQWH